MQRIHNDFKLKLFDGIDDNLGGNNLNIQHDDDDDGTHKRDKLGVSLSLDFDKEGPKTEKPNEDHDAPWNDVIN